MNTYLFDEDFYLALLKQSGADKVVKSKLSPGNRIVKRIERVTEQPFDHYRPARHFLENQMSLVPSLDADTLDRFESLFKGLQGLLK